MSNKSIGNKCEQEVSSLLRAHHFYVYLTGGNRNGSQPVDIIALKSNRNLLIDAKHVRNEAVSFTFERVEPNQEISLQYACEQCGIKESGFAIKFDRTGEIYFLPYLKYVEMKRNGKKSVKMSELELFSLTLN